MLYRGLFPAVILFYFIADLAFPESIVIDTHKIPSQDSVAEWIISNFDYVIYGHFIEPLIESDDDPLLPQEDLKIKFVISKFLNGDNGKDSVLVTVHSDMLIYPGESISRYKMREQLFDSIGGQFEKNRNEIKLLESEFNRGKISSDEYNLSITKLEEKLARNSLDYLAIPSRGMIAVIHGSTFYDENGAIKPREKFLLAFKSDLESKLVIPEVLNGNIYWGNQARELVTIIERLQ